MLHGQSGEFVGQAHALDFLRGLDPTSLTEERGCVYNLAANFWEGIEEILRRRSWFANHAVGGLCAHVELDSHFVGEAALF